MASDILVNRVAQSGIVTINLEDLYPSSDISVFDLKDFLFMEMILKEKDFRSALKATDWSTYQNNIVLIVCSADAIIPMWAYMLVGSYLEGHAKEIYTGSKEEYLTHYYEQVITSMKVDEYQDKMIVIKGCGEKPVPPQAYLRLAAVLKSVSKSIMYGEPCSTVPIYKKARIK